MKRREKEGKNGNTIVELIPESEEDLERLYEMEATGELDARHSFADDPSSLTDLDQVPPEDRETPGDGSS